jgi:hypothetical protein
VTSEAIADDIHHMRTVAECKDQHHEVLESKEVIEKNPYPDSDPIYSRHVVVDRDGKTTSEDSNGQNMFSGGSTSRKLTPEEEEELKRKLDHMQAELQRQQEQFQMNMNAFQQNMQTQMQNTFGKGFPFGNNQFYGQNYPNAPYNPFAGNFPFNYGFPYYYNPYPQNSNPDDNKRYQ